MKLTEEEKQMLNGENGEILQKIIEVLVTFGKFVGAKRFVPLSKGGHFSLSFGARELKGSFEILDKLIESNLKTHLLFTANPRPFDSFNFWDKFFNLFSFTKFFFDKQEELEEKLLKLGLVSSDSFSDLLPMNCDAVFGDVLSWSDATAVTYANSVIGAKVNDMGALLSLFCNILGKAPEFELLEDEKRYASIIIKIETERLPDAGLLGSAIAQKSKGKIPFIYGLEKHLNLKFDERTIAFLKDFSAGFASETTARLFHINNITPEAKNLKKLLILPSAQTITLNRSSIEEVKEDFEILWKNLDAKPKFCFIGCPHLNLYQLVFWANEIGWELRQNQRKKVKIKTVLLTSPETLEKFKILPEYEELLSFGVQVRTYYAINKFALPCFWHKKVITNSIILRTRTRAKFYEDAKLLQIITGGGENA